MLKRNKKAAILDLSIPIITLVFCVLVVFAQMKAVEKLSYDVISPVSVLKLGDKAFEFENEEFSLIKKVYCEGGSSEEIKTRFCSGFYSLFNVNFLTENSQPLTSDIRLDNLCESIYNFNLNDGVLSVSRAGLVKKEILKLDEERDNKKGFSVRLNFNLDRKYLLSEEDCN